MPGAPDGFCVTTPQEDINSVQVNANYFLNLHVHENCFRSGFRLGVHLHRRASSGAGLDLGGVRQRDGLGQARFTVRRNVHDRSKCRIKSDYPNQ